MVLKIHLRIAFFWKSQKNDWKYLMCTTRKTHFWKRKSNMLWCYLFMFVLSSLFSKPKLLKCIQSRYISQITTQARSIFHWQWIRLEHQPFHSHWTSSNRKSFTQKNSAFKTTATRKTTKGWERKEEGKGCFFVWEATKNMGYWKNSTETWLNPFRPLAQIHSPPKTTQDSYAENESSSTNQPIHQNTRQK